jgi:hypothetical protein
LKRALKIVVMTKTREVEVPQPLADEILKQYGDVLRVGILSVNGAEICWSTSGSTRTQLQAFNAAFCSALRQLPESSGLEDAVLSQAVYWFCKAVSINYALYEVLQAVKDKVGKDCSIATSGKAGRTIVDYGVHLQADHSMRVFVSWREKGNIIYCDPRTAKKQVKGTLSSLVTEFPLHPSPCFTPSYSLHMKLKRSYKQKIISKVTSLGKSRRHMASAGEQLCLDSPLHSQSSLTLESSCSTEAPSSLTSEVSFDSWDDWEAPSPVDSVLVSSPLHFCARSVKAAPRSCATASLRHIAMAPGFCL